MSVDAMIDAPLPRLFAQQAYVKASNTRASASFGGPLGITAPVAMSADGSTLAVSSGGESSAATGIDGNQADASAPGAGAVYVFTRAGTTWSQQAYIKASNTRAGVGTVSTGFGDAVALSADGSTLVVGSSGESSAATGIDGNQADTSALGAGAVYVFTRSGTTWSQQAYVKASNTRAFAQFGFAVALSADGNMLAVGSDGESSAATGIGGNQADTSAPYAGAVYVYTRTGTAWSQQAYLKASNTRPGGGQAENAPGEFGDAVALSADGSTLAVGSSAETSDATGINGNQADTSAGDAGAVYVYKRAGTTWSQQAYVKASNTRPQCSIPACNANFGVAVALSTDGDKLAVGSQLESSAATGIDGNEADTSATAAGAVYVYTRSGTTWSQQAYVKASNTRAGTVFGLAVALSGDGSTLAVGSEEEFSAATGIGGNQADNSAPGAGAVYLYTLAGTSWSQYAYVKASNTRSSAWFGAVALSADGSTLAVGSSGESSDATGINGNQADTSAVAAGAVYVFAAQ